MSDNDLLLILPIFFHLLMTDRLSCESPNIKQLVSSFEVCIYHLFLLQKSGAFVLFLPAFLLHELIATGFGH